MNQWTTIFLHFTLCSIAAESCCLGFIWINLNTAAPPRPAEPPRVVTDTAGHRDGFLYQPINYELVSCSLRAGSRDFFYSIKRLTAGYFLNWLREMAVRSRASQLLRLLALLACCSIFTTMQEFIQSAILNFTMKMIWNFKNIKDVDDSH